MTSRRLPEGFHILSMHEPHCANFVRFVSNRGFNHEKFETCCRCYNHRWDVESRDTRERRHLSFKVHCVRGPWRGLPGGANSSASLAASALMGEQGASCTYLG